MSTIKVSEVWEKKIKRVQNETRCGMVAICCTYMQTLLSPVIILDTVKHGVLVIVILVI